MGPELRTGLTSAHLVQLAFPALQDLPLLAPAARAFFHRTDRSAGSGAHEITRNQWRPGHQDRSGAGAVPQPGAMFLRVPGALVVQVRTATSRAEEQFARSGPGRAPGPRSQLPGEARNPRRPGNHRRRNVSFGRPGWNRFLRRCSPPTRVRETCAGWERSWSPSTWTRWLPRGPAAVELEVQGEIGGVAVRGRVDVLDVEGRLIDFKTASRRPSCVSPDYAFQLATYRQITPGASGEVRIDSLVKTQTVQIVQQAYTVEEPDIRATQVLYPMAQKAMGSGMYCPNRQSMLCSQKHCSFCEALRSGVRRPGPAVLSFVTDAVKRNSARLGMPLRHPGPGACPPTENRGECAYQTCAITPECAVAARSASAANRSGPPKTLPAAAGSG